MMKRPVHPGRALSEELLELGVLPTELARQIEVPPNRISQIINGKRDVSADTALRLGHWFGTSAQFWANLQNNFDLAIAEQQAGEAIAALPTKPKSAARDGLDL
ncbi:MAG: HigA family addiction module antitoxin [Alphaproteobacteria bacterium]